MASIVAKQIQLGQRVVIVRCEKAIYSGKHYRNKLNFMEDRHKHNNTNPRRGGPFHQTAPSHIIYRTIRGMIPYKTAKGAAAMGRLKCFDGCPVSANTMKKMVIPDALKAAKLAPRAKFAVLGNVAKDCGWTQQELIDELEEKRISKNHEWYVKKVELEKAEQKEIQKNNPGDRRRIGEIELRIFLRDLHINTSVLLERKTIIVVAHKKNPLDAFLH
jgi:large subunit ribosomal protein L13Ae